MTMSLRGMYELRDYRGTVTVGSGEKLTVTKIGTKKSKIFTTLYHNNLDKLIIVQRNVTMKSTLFYIDIPKNTPS